MAERLISSLWVAFGMVMLVIIGGISMVSPFITNEGSDEDAVKVEKFEDKFDKLSDMEQTTDSMAARFQNEGDRGLFGVLNSLIGVAWDFLSLLMDTINGGLSFVFSFFGNMGDYFGFIPSFIITIVVVIITATVGFLLFGALFQRRL